MNKFSKLLILTLLKLPINRFNSRLYSLLGVKLEENSRMAKGIVVVGDYSNIELKKNAEINVSCFLLAREKISIGENSTLAYQVSIITSSNPNAPYNLLSKIYKPIIEPVLIGNNTWIGARATVLPGVSIGNYCVIAAGALVNKNIPDYSVVAGIPGKIIKRLDSNLFS